MEAVDGMVKTNILEKVYEEGEWLWLGLVDKVLREGLSDGQKETDL